MNPLLHELSDVRFLQRSYEEKMPYALGMNRSTATTWKSVFSRVSKFRDQLPGYFLHLHIYFSAALPTTLMSDVVLVLAYSILVVFPPTFNWVQNTSWTHFALGIPSNLPPKNQENNQAFSIMIWYVHYSMTFQVFSSSPLHIILESSL